MGFSSVVGEQRQKEAKARNSFLAFSLIGSLALHAGFLLFGINNLWNRVPEVEEEPVEVVIVDPPPAPEPEKPPEKPPEEPKESGGSVASSPPRQTPTRPKPAPRQTTTKPVPTKPKVAPSPPSPVAKQPPDEPQQELVEELKQPPKPTPSPEAAVSPKPVTQPSPPPAASPKPAPPAQTPEQDIAKLREQLASQRSATNNPPAPAQKPSQTQTSNSQPAATRTPRQGTPQGQGRGEGDPEGSDSGSVACRSNCKPKYPERARKRGQEGRVAVRVVADANGKVTSAEIARSSGNSALDQAALKQARQAKISAPAGKPVTMNFNFSLD